MIILLDDDRNYVNIIYIWVYYNDLTVLPTLESWFLYGMNHPQMASNYSGLLKLLVVWNIFIFDSIYLGNIITTSLQPDWNIGSVGEMASPNGRPIQESDIL